ncbi:hypothetical protein JCGZ_23728 [Jatropha curcas]|uniref:Uncharacterized protein n=1 Tax=Jatropha curcas TaxID=180498 RepID=A0A067JSU7_JATCU|nr:hypothetical protein JCGZ_23728 [Jatropha curcas]
MATENVMDWLLGDTVIDLMTCPTSHDLKLQEFVPDVGTSISLRHDLPSHLCWGAMEKVVRRGKSGGNTFVACSIGLVACTTWAVAYAASLWLMPQSTYPGHARHASCESVSDVTPNCIHVSIDNYNEVCQLYEAARLMLAVARLSDEHVSRVDMAPPASRGRGIQRGRRAGRESRHRPVIIEEIEESGSEDSKETASNMS